MLEDCDEDGVAFLALVAWLWWWMLARVIFIRLLLLLLLLPGWYGLY